MEIFFNPDTRTITMVLEKMTITAHAHIDKTLGHTIAKMLTDAHLEKNNNTPYDAILSEMADQINSTKRYELT